LEAINAPAPAVRIENADFVRNGRYILAGIDWCIGRGEHWALLGANGSGKTTLLKLINGYEWATRGAITVLGQRFGQCDIRALRKSIGWVSSSLEQRVPPRLTASRVVASGLDASIGVYRDFAPEEEARVAEALAAMNAADTAGRAFGLLSQGEQQRVIIARALVAQPRLLILDEPCAGLDPKARHAFLSDLGRLAESQSSPTMIYVTHHIEEIRPWLTRVLALRDGKIAAMGDRGEVLTAETLGRIFGVHCDVHESNGAYHLSMRHDGD
jgi:iron complex transport system ATP-binding protein